MNPIAQRYLGNGRYFRGSYKDEGLQAVEEGKKSFPFFSNVSYRYYEPRPFQRYLLVGDRFGSYLQGRMLDVGSRSNSLREVLKKEDAEVVDKNNPNLPSFDWEKEILPYADDTFDAVVCLDTLEHINDFHNSFFDLLRVSKRYVIISLPNCWRKAFKQMLLGRSGQGAYGLPPEKPMDRHKWFMNAEDIDECFFYNSAAGPYPYEVKEIIYHIPQTIPRHKLLYGLVRMLLPERYMKNLLVNTTFVVLEKKTRV